MLVSCGQGIHYNGKLIHCFGTVTVNNNRLKWACRRGMLELDLLLLAFLENAYPQLDIADKALFQRILKSEDQELFGWLLGRQPVPGVAEARIIALIREHNGFSH